MRFKLFKETFTMTAEKTVVTVEREDAPGDFVNLPYLGSDAYNDYFVIGMFASNDIVHLEVAKK